MPRRPEETLTPREFEAITMLALDGAHTKEIAKVIGCSYFTAKRHIYSAMNKIGCETRTSLALWYVRRYPSAKAQEAGYINCWIYAAERIYGQYRRGKCRPGPFTLKSRDVETLLLERN